MQTDWFWEGNIQDRLAAFLKAEGWSIDQQADTAAREHGIDLCVSQAGRTLILEVKGYPSDRYERGDRQGMPKKTRPSNQAAKWFAQAFMEVIRRHTETPSAELAIAFPETPRYLDLLSKARWALDRLGIGVYLVTPSGQVYRWLEHVPLSQTEGGGCRD